jgi:fructuronate reductase
LAGWLCHLRGHGVRADDPHLDELQRLGSGAIAQAAPRVLSWLDPALGADDALVDSVVAVADRLVLEASH